jgi:hypothetical protein
MPALNKREGLARKVDTAAIKAEVSGQTTATLILRMARLEIDQAKPEAVEIMPRNNPYSKSNRLTAAGQSSGWEPVGGGVASRFQVVH